MSNQIYRQISESLIRMGAKTAIISIDNLSKIQRLFTDIIDVRPYSIEFYEMYLKRLKEDNSTVFPDAKSIIIIVYPQQITGVNFNYNGRAIEIIIPPTYIYKDAENNIRSLLQKILSGYGYLLKNSTLPGKFTTVLSGLGKYGRNNLCYIKGMGSFNTPLIYLSDLPVEETQLSEISLASSCKNCKRCIDICPTGAINRDSFIINPEICITYFNENELELPDWILTKWQNTLVGCMLCQRICPMNKKLLNNINRSINFTEADTDLILQNTEFKDLPQSIKDKLTQLCLESYYEIIPRNLRILIT